MEKNVKVEELAKACGVEDFPSAEEAVLAGERFVENNIEERQIGTLLWIRFVLWKYLSIQAKGNLDSITIPFPSYCDTDFLVEFLKERSSENARFDVVFGNGNVKVSWMRTKK